MDDVLGLEPLTRWSGFDLFWQQSDAITRAVALLLLAMSVGAWVLILWKGWVLRRARRDIDARGAGVLGRADAGRRPRSASARSTAKRVLLPLLDAATATRRGGTLEAHGHLESQLTRRLRDALHRVLAHLQFGQVCWRRSAARRPSSACSAPSGASTTRCVGIAAAGAITIERVSGPVGEALIMTAAGLAVAIPAVLAYNMFGKRVGALRGRARRLRARPARDADRATGRCRGAMMQGRHAHCVRCPRGALSARRAAGRAQMAFGRLERTASPRR